MFRRTVPLAVAALVAVLVSTAPANAQGFFWSGARISPGGYYNNAWDGYSYYRPGVTLGNPSSGVSINIGVTPSWGNPYYRDTNVPNYNSVSPPYVHRWLETYPYPSPAPRSFTERYYSRSSADEGFEESAAPPVVSSAATAASTALMSIRVPAGARLWIDDYESGQTGSIRRFESPATLRPGRTYVYTVTASWTGPDGQPVTRARKIDVEPGREVYVDMIDYRP
jgi:uncharacterized protein (TIGR03000 family)